MAERGLCSRREADELIARGWVKVDGIIIDKLGTRVEPHCEIELHPSASKKLQNLVTILLNKPIGYVSGTPEDDYEPAVRLITAVNQDLEATLMAQRTTATIQSSSAQRFNSKKSEPQHRSPASQLATANVAQLKREYFEGLAPAGRLDIDSQGLIVFTQNGQVAKKLIGANSDVEKEYLVRVEGRLTEANLKRLNHGLSLDDRPLKPAFVEWINEDQLRFVLKEGRKRQIRRMCELVGLEVTGLKRVRIGNVKLGRLQEGKWRFLGPDENF